MELNEITFGKDRYHQHMVMEQWCQDHIGKGRWTWSGPVTWEGMGDNLWVMHSMFGNVTFVFKDQKHFSMFLLRWA